MKCDECIAGRHRQCSKPVYNQYRDYTQCCDGIPIKRGR